MGATVVRPNCDRLDAGAKEPSGFSGFRYRERPSDKVESSPRFALPIEKRGISVKDFNII